MILINSNKLVKPFFNLTIMKRMLAALLFLLVTSTTFSQKVSAVISRDKIRLGDYFDLKLQVQPTNNSRITVNTWFNIPDTFTNFQVVNRQRIDTVSIASTKGYTQVITLTSFDTGRHSLPAFTVMVGNKQYHTLPFSVTVIPIDVTMRKDYNDIKDIIEPEPEEDHTLWKIIAGAIVWVIILYFVIKKWIIAKKKILTPIHPKDYSLTSILQQLDALEAVYQSHKYQLFYTELMAICKDFSDYQLHITTHTKTTAEYISILKEKMQNKDLLNQYIHLLQVAETVKFAKAIPSSDECKQSIAEAKTFITQLASSQHKTAADVI